MSTALAFSDLASGGSKLADALTSSGIERDAIVLGIVRGGVPAACQAALKLDLPLDVLLLKPLIAQATGRILRAAHVAGTTVFDEGCQTFPAGSVERLVVDEGAGALVARAAACRGSRPAVHIASRTIVLIDNGMRTGRTMAAAISTVRAMNVKRIVAATPVASAAAVALVESVADELVSLTTQTTLGNVAMAYQRFDVPNDARICELVDCSARSSCSLC